MYNVLFVCLGNICRSPAAEAIFQATVKKAGLHNQVFVDSCGTTAHHAGEKADLRMSVHAEKRGYHIESLARGFLSDKDFSKYDTIVAMDNQNFADLQELANSELQSQKIKKFVSYCKNIAADEVKDPYYGGPNDFEKTLDLIEDGCQLLLREVKEKISSPQPIASK